MTHPYADLPDRAYWRRGVAEAQPPDFEGLYLPERRIERETRIATAGSCFAQHIGQALHGAGCTVLDAEPAPPMMPDGVAHRFGYRLFSGRYGNIYTARQLRQLLEEVTRGVVDDRFVWTLPNGHHVDAFRPNVEPEGLASRREVVVHRNYHVEKTSQMLREAEVFIFTLGLTEAWRDVETGRVFPICPGVVGGEFDANAHEFVNFRYSEIVEDLSEIRAILHQFRPGMDMLLTVSPVPLTATASGAHVLDATGRSKATLRAAAADFAEDTPGVSYFPSYELVTSPIAGGPFFAPNLRGVTASGVDLVMNVFLSAHGLVPPASAAKPITFPGTEEADGDGDDLVCEEMLLEAFAR